jgi:hypothetical protein
MIISTAAGRLGFGQISQSERLCNWASGIGDRDAVMFDVKEAVTIYWRICADEKSAAAAYLVTSEAEKSLTVI